MPLVNFKYQLVGIFEGEDRIVSAFTIAANAMR